MNFVQGFSKRSDIAHETYISAKVIYLRCCSNLGLLSVRLPTLYFREQFQNDKALIAKEMETGGRPSLASYVHMPHGGMCNVRKHIGAAKWRSPDEMGGHGSLVRVRNGMGPECAATESFTILAK